MPDLPSISGREAVRAFERAGFSLDRVKGSHHILKKPGHRNALSVPVHGNKNVKKGTLRALIKAAGLTEDEFIAFL
ncbi:MAG: type II toxin-antitoxin system HicA family toxin [Planctomycetes bacterium]|nr:type II toxin-antitoxin system HicA family toxin [Planctomycetota bacterium]